MKTISVDRLRDLGISLVVPTNESRTSRADAEEVAAREMGSRGALESVLADCQLTRPGISTTRTCWAVSLDPVGQTSFGPIGVPKKPATMAVALIDADSGELIRGFVSTKP